MTEFSLESAVKEANKDYMKDLIPYKDVSLGEEFEDLDGNVWEKRERYALSWWEGDRIETADFRPDELVRLK